MEVSRIQVLKKRNINFLELPHQRKDVMVLSQALRHLLLKISNPFQGK